MAIPPLGARPMHPHSARPLAQPHGMLYIWTGCRLVRLRSQASVVKWHYPSFPSWSRGFDSPRSLNKEPDKIGLFSFAAHP